RSMTVADPNAREEMVEPSGSRILGDERRPPPLGAGEDLAVTKGEHLARRAARVNLHDRLERGVEVAPIGMMHGKDPEGGRDEATQRRALCDAVLSAGEEGSVEDDATDLRAEAFEERAQEMVAERLAVSDLAQLSDEAGDLPRAVESDRPVQRRRSKRDF